MASYEDRLRRVFDHIYDHPDGDLSLDALADVAAMSRFHWHRVFHAMTGETCAQAVRRLRAHRAACWLVQTDWTIDQIASRAGYDNPQSFARLFRSHFGMTPMAFRQAGQAGPPDVVFVEGQPNMFDVEIKEKPDLRLAAMTHIGPYPEIGRAFEQVSAIFTSQNLWAQARGMVGVYCDDPASKPESELSSEAGVVIEDGFAMPNDLHEKRLMGGRHAVLVFKGPYSGLRAAYDHMFGQWLPQSGEEPADAPCYEIYLNNPREVAPAELLTEICVPLEPRT